ncbi:phosphotransferase [Catenuloplanes atrovinosus]|uniref:Aminoglycoside phosphotransferase n=1 Tax=Catenuloplanes atrovinosus TaxID=137266 RepID=A0AAE3YSA8_9ACTN|nr:phosphotransferase [Catenuloplanes atrovinosus]MDR7277712.1 hypothetical protein [Catenuloplanes atrovinosus]
MTGDWDKDRIGCLLQRLCTDAGLAAPAGHTPIRVWAHSGVERIRLTDARTVVLKYAKTPFTGEDRLLTACRRAGVPVPDVLAARHDDGILTMLLEDLGHPIREASAGDAARVAVVLHQQRDMTPFSPLPVWSDQNLAMLPGKALTALGTLTRNSRLGDVTGDIAVMLAAADKVAAKRAAGASLAPFGLVHGELHPTSVHIGARGLRLVDLAKTFIGPGLLDLATWYGTRSPPNPQRLHAHIRAYVAAGGARDALTTRGGLPAADWALGWHRMWAANWLLDQAALGRNMLPSLETLLTTVQRQVTGACALFRVCAAG